MSSPHAPPSAPQRGDDFSPLPDIFVLTHILDKASHRTQSSFSNLKLKKETRVEVSHVYMCTYLPSQHMLLSTDIPGSILPSSFCEMVMIGLTDYVLAM